MHYIVFVLFLKMEKKERNLNYRSTVINRYLRKRWVDCKCATKRWGYPAADRNSPSTVEINENQ